MLVQPTPDLLHVLYWITIVAVIVSSASAVLKAGFKQFDLFGVIIIAVATGLGGGSLRDMLLDREVFWIRDQMFFIASLLSAIGIFLTARLIVFNPRFFIIPDAAVLTLFAAFILLASLSSSSAFAWPEVDTMNMCNKPVKVVRAYNGGAKSWANRDQYTNSQKQRLYAANCPDVRQGNTRYSDQDYYGYQKTQSSATGETCVDCYKKGFRDGYRAGKKKAANKVKTAERIQRRSTGGYRSYAEKVEDCKRVDRANYASRTKVVSRR